MRYVLSFDISFARFASLTGTPLASPLRVCCASATALNSFTTAEMQHSSSVSWQQLMNSS
jgi:hypothetical protein